MSFTTKLFKAVIFTGVFLSASANAHVHLSKTVPAAESVASVAPEKLVLGFTADVKVIKLSLKDNKGESVDFGFKPVVQAAKSMEWSLPALSAGTYIVNWTVLGADGHKMEGQYPFTIQTGHDHHNAH